MMKTNLFTLAVMTAAVLAAGTAQAQTTAPMNGASAPMSRDDVKRERDNAAIQGTKPMGAAGITKDRPKGDAETKKSANTGNTREAVKAEAKDSVHSGDVPRGEADISKNHPRGGAVGKEPKTGNSRQAVRAEARDAVKTNEVPKGEANITADAPKGGVPMKP